MLNFLFAATAVLGLSIGYISQAGYREATIMVLENALKIDEFGSVVGDLVCDCQLPDSTLANKFIC